MRAMPPVYLENPFAQAARAGSGDYDPRMPRLNRPRAARAVPFFAMFVVAAAGGSEPRAAEALSVRDCVRRAREVAPEVRIAGAAREAARQDSLLHQFDQRPAFSLLGGATVAPRDFYDPVITNLGEYELKLGVAWPLRDAGGPRHPPPRR